MTNSYKLSIVFPCYNESHRLPASFRKIKKFVFSQPYATELIFVNDGSTDSTAQILRVFVQELSKRKDLSVRLINHVPNKGKGASVRMGMLSADGKIRLFSDADISTPLEEINKFFPYFDKGYNFVFGSRELKMSKKTGEPFWRTLIGAGFRFFLFISGVKGGVHDTQCGFKAFTKSAAKTIFTRQKLNGGSFDIELLFIARKRHMRYIEVPVSWEHVKGSTIDVMHDMLHHPIDILKMYYFWLRGDYD